MPLKCCWRYSRKIRLLRFTCAGIRGGLITLKNVERHSEPTWTRTGGLFETTSPRGGGCKRCNVANSRLNDARASFAESIMKFRQDSIAATSVCSVGVPATRGEGVGFASMLSIDSFLLATPRRFGWWIRMAESRRLDGQSSKFEDRWVLGFPNLTREIDDKSNT